jgi:hypothetical protein
VVERVVHPGVLADLRAADRRHPAADRVLRLADELDQSAADDVGLRDQRQLDLEPVRHRNVVRVHPGDDVVAGRGQARVQGRAEPAVGRQRQERDRHRAAGLQLAEALRELGPDRPVLHDDRLGRPHGLLVDRAAVGPAQEIGPVTVIDREQERERLVHVRR